MRKIIIVLMVGIVFSFSVTASGNNNFISNFFKQYQAHNKNNKISQRVKNVISAEFEKNLPKQLLRKTDITNKVVMTLVNEENANEIVKSLIRAFDEIYDDEKSHECHIKRDSNNRSDTFKFEVFAGKYAEQNPLILQKELLPLISNTNNWNAPMAYILRSLLDDSAIENPELQKEYMEIYQKLVIKRNEKHLPREKINPVIELHNAVYNCLQATFSQMPLPELEKLLEKEQNRFLASIMLFGVGEQPSEKASEIYSKYMRKFFGYGLGTREKIEGFRELCDEYKKWNKRLEAAGYDKKKAEKQYKSGVAVMDKMLKSIPLNNSKEILQLPEKLHKAEELAGENPESGMFPERYLKPIKQKPVPECKEAYWQILQRNPDEGKYKIEPKIALAFGEAFGKIMTKEDVPRAINFINKSKSLKLLILMEKLLGKDPNNYKTLAVTGIIEGIRCPPRKEIIQEFYKNRDKIKDKSMRKSFIEIAKKNGVAK